MAIYDFDQPLYQLNGEPFLPTHFGIPPKKDEKPSGEPAKLGDVLRIAVINSSEVERRTPEGQVIPKKESKEEQWDRYELASRIKDCGKVEITETQRELAKKCAHQAFGPEAMGVIWELLESPVPAGGDADDDDADSDDGDAIR